METKIKGSASSPKNGPPYREIPPLPERKPRSRARYTIVLISESGASRQLELTAFRLRVGAAVALGVLALVVVAIAGSAGVFSGTSKLSSGQAGELAKTVNLLQEQLKEKQAALIVQERRIKELQELPTLTTVPSSRSNVGEGPKQGMGEPTESSSDGPLTGRNETRDVASRDAGFGNRDRDRSDDAAESRTSDAKSRHAALQSEQPAPPVGSEEAASPAPSPIIEFDAQKLTAVLKEPRERDTLSFRLVKDHPDVRFAGYLFVFVEVTDKQGQTHIYAYPKQTRVGDENIPSDFKEGESVAFKYNTRVELPLPSVEAGTGTSLSGVSILLYGETGKIVYQRGFERKELKIVSAKGNKSDGPGAKASTKRQAL